MSETTISATTFSEATLARFAREVAKYPAEQRQSAVMACLAIVQQEQGHISSESEQAVANYLGMDAITVHEVTTFYDMYNQNPVGKFKLSVAPICRAVWVAQSMRCKCWKKKSVQKSAAPAMMGCLRLSVANAWALAPMHPCCW